VFDSNSVDRGFNDGVMVGVFDSNSVDRVPYRSN
jgi:hypothetical protein